MIALILFMITISLYLYGVRKFRYWSKRGIKHDRPLPFVGNNLRQFLLKASYAMIATEQYFKYPEEKVVGFYRGSTPELIIRDPEIIKRILMIDFKSFHARGIHPHKNIREPLLRNIFFSDGDMWKLIRNKFSSAFSTGRLKAMFPMITDRAAKLQLITEKVCSEDLYDARELMARYTTEFIGMCGFGLNMDTLSDENSEFRKLGKRIFHRNLRDLVCTALITLFPNQVSKHLHMLSPELESSMVHLVQTVMKQRNYKLSNRNDFIDLLLEIKQTQGVISGESIEHQNADGSPKTVEIELDDMLLTAQVFLFFGAGFETSSGTSSYTLHQLAFHPECQEKLRNEIDTVLAKHGEKITYEAVREMSYLEMVFYESMRLYPSVAYLLRCCSVPEYEIPELGISLNEGVRIMIPVQALHRDEKYFENPLEFKPERFNDENKRNIKKFVFLPFGEGQRACVGARLGAMQAMAGVAAVIQKFRVEPAACTKQFPQPDPMGIVSESFIGGLPLKFTKRSKGDTSHLFSTGRAMVLVLGTFIPSGWLPSFGPNSKNDLVVFLEMKMVADSI